MTKHGFQDNFSKQAKTYSKYRPTYPKALFEFLSSLTEENELAWDCATGNGQSALSLIEYYKNVYATDASEEQLKNAVYHKKITYNVEKAEHSRLEDKSVDLITVAQAVHWFNFDAFYKEAKRVLKRNGVLAVWTYGLPSISTEVDKLVRHYHDEIVGPFWQKENKLVANEYKNLPFPFQEISVPVFTYQREIHIEDLIGLLHSWSATQRYKEHHGYNPVSQIMEPLNTIWPQQKKQQAIWQIYVKAGKPNNQHKE